MVMVWIVDRSKISGSDLSNLPNAGGIFKDPALNVGVLNPGGTTYLEVRASTNSPSQANFISRMEGDGTIM